MLVCAFGCRDEEARKTVAHILLYIYYTMLLHLYLKRKGKKGEFETVTAAEIFHFNATVVPQMVEMSFLIGSAGM